MARMLQFFEVVAGGGFQEIHIVMRRAGFLFAEEDCLSGIGNVAFQHGCAGDLVEIPCCSQLLLKEIVPAIDNITARSGISRILGIRDASDWARSVTGAKEQRKNWPAIGRDRRGTAK